MGGIKLDEKIMVNDILECTKSNILNYDRTIFETDNLGLRQLMIELRNEEESFEYELYKIAKIKEYLTISIPASTNEIQNIKNKFE